MASKRTGVRPHLLFVQAHCTRGRGEVIEHWLAGLLFWARSLAGDLTGAPFLCDALVLATRDLRDEGGELIEKIETLRQTHRAPPGVGRSA